MIVFIISGKKSEGSADGGGFPRYIRPRVFILTRHPPGLLPLIYTRSLPRISISTCAYFECAGGGAGILACSHEEDNFFNEAGVVM